MEGNPYQEIVQLFRSADPADGLQLCEGTVTAVSPLTVSAFRLSFSGADVRVNAQLLAGWKQTVSIQQPMAPIEGVETVTEGGLHAGDRVLCLTDGGRALYFFLCRFCTAPAAQRVVTVCSIVCLLPCSFIGFFLLLQSGYNFSLLLVTVYLCFLLAARPVQE